MSALYSLIQKRSHSSRTLDLKWPKSRLNLLINGVIVGRFINMNKFGEINYNLCLQFDILDLKNSLSCLQIINNSPVFWWFQRIFRKYGTSHVGSQILIWPFWQKFDSQKFYLTQKNVLAWLKSKKKTSSLLEPWFLRVMICSPILSDVGLWTAD